MFQIALMEPVAYRYFMEHQDYAEGTMFVLNFYGSRQRLSTNRSRFVMAEVMGSEVHVLDSARFKDGHNFFNFGMDSNTAQVMPDGRLAAYECATVRGTGICLEDLVSGASRELIRLPGHNRNPVFSPDSLFIAFVAEVSGRQIVTVSDHIGHSWPVADATGIDGVSWSPYAVWLLLAPQRADGSTDVFRITGGGTDPQWLTQTPRVSERSPYYSAADKYAMGWVLPPRAAKSQDYLG